MKSLYEESAESLKLLVRQILKAGTILGVLIAISAILNLNKQHFLGTIFIGIVTGIAVVVHDEAQSR